MAKVFIWQFTERYRVFEGVSDDDEFYLDYEELSNFSGKWEAPKLINADEKGRINKLGDFPATTGFAHLISENARKKLGSIFENYGNFLPVEILDDDVDEIFYLYKCTNIIDCLNVEKSKVKYSPFEPDDIVMIREPVFYEEKIPKNSFFVVPENIGGNIYVSEGIKNEVKRFKLKGMVLIEKYFDEKKPWIS